MPANLSRVLRALELHGILLESDATLLSVCALVAGAPIRGSWWGHPQAHAIFRVNTALAEHPDVLVTKLVSGKVTFVYRKLWPAVAAVGSAREPWQVRSLSSEARLLLEKVTREGEVRAAGAAARELENVLLVHSQQVHTTSGAHAKVLATWERWAAGVTLPGQRMKPAQGRKQLEERMAALNQRFAAKGRLPWSRQDDS